MLRTSRPVFGLAMTTVLGACSPPPAHPNPSETTTTTPSTDGPLPISGGTLLITRDGEHILASDPDRHRVWVFTRNDRTPAVVALPAHSEPGRLAEDGTGKVHVVLRSGGAIATIDPSTAQVLATRDVCAAPRGIAYQSAGDQLHVACADGQLVTLHASGIDIVRRVQLARDLRDVLVSARGVSVTTFRSAQVIALDASGAPTGTLTPAGTTSAFGVPSESNVAWRALTLQSGEPVLVHQQAQTTTMGTVRAYYGESVETAVVSSNVTIVNGPSTGQQQVQIAGAVLPVDLAVTRDEQTLAVASAGTSEVYVAGFETYSPQRSLGTPGVPVAVAFDDDGSLWVQTRGPAQLLHTDAAVRNIVTTLALDDTAAPEPLDDGATAFHTATVAFVACASCHPEGGDDGHTWNFVTDVGVRRTQSIRGGILATAPFHWDGSLADMNALVHATFETRMHGQPMSAEQIVSLGRWVDAIPRVPAATANDTASAERGRALFESADVACTTCHAGPRFTDNRTVDVGTGGAMQVPSLRGVVMRAPYMHNGCATTLRDRFGSCGGGDHHGHTSQLASNQIGDLVAYLETL